MLILLLRFFLFCNSFFNLPFCLFVGDIQDLVAATQQAAAELSVTGSPSIDLIIADTQDDPATALQQVQNYYAQGVRVFTGIETSDIAEAIMAWASENAKDAGFLSLTATAPSLSQYPNFFRMRMHDTYQAQAVVATASRLQAQQLYLLHDDSVYGREFANSLGALSSVNASVEFPAGANTTEEMGGFAQAILSDVRSAGDNPRAAVVFVGQSGAFQAAMEDLVDDDDPVPWIVTDSITYLPIDFADVVQAAVPQGLYGTVYTGDRYQSHNAKRVGFSAEVQKTLGRPVTNPAVPLTFDALLLIQRAFAGVGASVAGIAEFGYGLSGSLSFDGSGDRYAGSFAIGAILPNVAGVQFPFQVSPWCSGGAAYLTSTYDEQFLPHPARGNNDNKFRASQTLKRVRGVAVDSELFIAPDGLGPMPYVSVSEDGSLGHFINASFWDLLREVLVDFTISLTGVDPLTQSEVSTTIGGDQTDGLFLPSSFAVIAEINGTDVATGLPVSLAIMCPPATRSTDSITCAVSYNGDNNSTLRLSDTAIKNLIGSCGGVPSCLLGPNGPGPGCVTSLPGCATNILKQFAPEIFGGIPDLPPFKPSLPGSCVLGGTPVLMADGTTKSVDHLRPGDRIASAQWEDLGVDSRWRMEPATVALVDVTVLDGRPLLGFNGLAPFITDDHPFVHPNFHDKVLSFNKAATSSHFPEIEEHIEDGRPSVVAAYDSSSGAFKATPVSELNTDSSRAKETRVYTVITDRLEPNAFVANGYLIFSDSPFLLLRPGFALVLKDIMYSVATPLSDYVKMKYSTMYDSNLLERRNAVQAIGAKLVVAMEQASSRFGWTTRAEGRRNLYVDPYQAKVRELYAQIRPEVLGGAMPALLTSIWRASPRFEFLDSMPYEVGKQVAARLAKAAIAEFIKVVH